MVTRRATADLVEFVAPGLLHGLGNSLFLIQGHAQMLRSTATEVTRVKSSILRASEKAMHALEVLRHLIAEPGGDGRPQAGILLHRLCDTVRVPLRDRGLHLHFAHASVETPARIDGTVLCQSVVEILRHLAASLPRGLEHRVSLDLVSQDAGGISVVLRIDHGPNDLPFPLDLAGVTRRSSAILRHHGVRAEAAADGRELRLRLPGDAAREATDAPPQLEAR